MRARLGACLLGLVAACGVAPVPAPGPPRCMDYAPNPAACAPVEPSCADYCEQARRLGCEGGAPSPGGESCESVCELVRSSGIVRFDLRCRASAQSCEQMDACERVSSQDPTL